MGKSEEIKLPVGDGRVKRFSDLEEVRDFIETERKAFSWLTSKPEYKWDTNPPNTLGDKVGEQYSRMENSVERQLGSDNPDIDVVANAFSEAYEVKGLAYSETPKGEYIDELRENEDDEYAALVYFYLSDVNSGNEVRKLKAFSEADLYQRDLVSSDDAQKRSLENLQNEWEERYNNSLEQASEKIKDVVESCVERFAELESKQEELQESVSKKDQQFGDLLTKSESELEDLTDEYRDQIAMLAPVEYWTEKANDHLWRSVGWGVVTVVVGVILGALFTSQAQEVLGTKGQPNYAELVVLLTYATLGVWGLRLVVKQLLSNLRLRRDARERYVMLQSFLAMLREGHIDPEEKETILSTLFRPAQDQYGGDATPYNAAGLLQRLVS